MKKNLLVIQELNVLEGDEFTFIYNAVKALEISAVTMRRRHNGIKCRPETHINDQNMSESEESVLIKWITTLSVAELFFYATIKVMIKMIRNDRITFINNSSNSFIIPSLTRIKFNAFSNIVHD